MNFLWWFIQGGIMNVETRHKLWSGWGLCARHATGWLTAEAAFRNCRFHGPAILYVELMRQAVRALAPTGRLAGARVRRALRARTECLLCEAGLGAGSPGFVPGDRLETGRDVSRLAEYMRATEPYWRTGVCGRCDRSSGDPRCRAHLIEDLDRDPLCVLRSHRQRLAEILARLERYERSFRWERRGSDTPPDRAALVAAVGWCSGWNELLGVMR